MSAPATPNEVLVNEAKLPADAPHRMPGLDGLRAVSAACVMASHLMAHGKLPYTRWVPDGLLAVLVFFGLSGFLMGSIVAREKRRGEFGPGRFLARRAARIWPAAMAYLAVISAASLAGALPPLPWSGVLGTAAMLVNYVPTPQRHDLFGHYWSLGIEVQFYVFVALLGATMPPRVARRALAAAACALVAWHFLRSPVLDGRPARSALFLLAGFVAGTAASEGARWTSALSRIPALPLFAAWWCACALPPARWFEVALAALVVPLILSVAAGSPTGALLAWAPLRWLGERSYGFYLWQQLFAFPPLSGRLPWWALAGLAVLMAHASFTCVERPIIRRVARRLAIQRNMGVP